MYDLSKIDLGRDDAEYDQSLRQYFLKTPAYNNAKSGRKSIILGRKGSGKSAIFTILQEDLKAPGTLIVPFTSDDFSLSLFQDFEQQGMLVEQACTNAWKMTLLSLVVWRLHESKALTRQAEDRISHYYPFIKDQVVLSQPHRIREIIEGVGGAIKGIDTPVLKIHYDWKAEKKVIPPRIIEAIAEPLQEEWPAGKVVRVLIDRLDDYWDGTPQSKARIIGLLRAAHDLKGRFGNRLIITVFLRSDIYDALNFNSKGHMWQDVEKLSWENEKLKEVVCERVRVSLGLSAGGDGEISQIWEHLFSQKSYRGASLEKYIIDRTFKQPRDIISFVRFALEEASENRHQAIEPSDMKDAEREYCEGKYDDLISEYEPQFSYIRVLLGSFRNFRYKSTRAALLFCLEDFIRKHNLSVDAAYLLNQLSVWGVIGAKHRGRISYYYDGLPGVVYGEYFFHPALRPGMGIAQSPRRTGTD